MRLFFLLFCLTSSFAFSQKKKQTFEVEYSSILLDEKDDYGYYSFDDCLLTTNGDRSVYSVVSKDTIVFSDFFGAIDTSENHYNFLYYKNLSDKKTVYYKENRGLSKPKIIKDEYKTDWKLITENKKILGFDCQKATAKFRGRTYEAFFTKDIPYNDGPYKFDGLPGLVLQVKSLDGALQITAKTITNVEEKVPENPYLNLENTINFDSYKKLYKKYFDTMTGYRSDMDSEIYVPKRYIEYVVEE